MSYIERYHNEERWWAKVTIMEIFHLHALHLDKKWTIQNTASAFEVSEALVSENLKLAEAMHKDSEIMNIDSRNKALKRIKS